MQLLLEIHLKSPSTLDKILIRHGLAGEPHFINKIGWDPRLSQDGLV